MYVVEDNGDNADDSDTFNGYIATAMLEDSYLNSNEIEAKHIQLMTEYSIPLIPSQKAAAISFSDIDPTSGQIAGTFTIKKAIDENSLDEYAVYWGKNQDPVDCSGAGSCIFISSVTKTGSDVTYNIPYDTNIPSGMTHLIVKTRNTSGEMNLGISHQIIDN